MQDRPFITIGIPTWNRCSYLNKNLITLMDQIKTQTLINVEVLIVDNASDDGTEELCRNVARMHSFVNYHRHATNLGANANFQHVISLANGEYVWLLGDDDLIANNCISQVMNDIHQHQPDAVVGAALYAETQEKATHRHIRDLTCMDGQTLAREDIIGLAGKISGLIYKKSSIVPLLSQAEKIIKQTRTPWPHLVWLLMLMSDPKRRLLVLPYGINQLVGANWHNLLFTGQSLIQIHFIDYQKMILALQSCLPEDIYQTLLARSIAHRARSLLKCVLYGTYVDSYGDLLKFAYGFFPQIQGWVNKVYYLIFILFPLSVPRGIRKILFTLATCFRYERLNQTISRIQQTSEMTRKQGEKASASRAFDSEGL